MHSGWNSKNHVWSSILGLCHLKSPSSKKNGPYFWGPTAFIKQNGVILSSMQKKGNRKSKPGSKELIMLWDKKRRLQVKQMGQSTPAARPAKGLRQGWGLPEKPSYLESKQSNKTVYIMQLDLQTKNVHLVCLSVLQKGNVSPLKLYTLTPWQK